MRQDRYDNGAECASCANAELGNIGAGKDLHYIDEGVTGVESDERNRVVIDRAGTCSLAMAVQELESCRCLHEVPDARIAVVTTEKKGSISNDIRKRTKGEKARASWFQRASAATTAHRFVPAASRE